MNNQAISSCSIAEGKILNGKEKVIALAGNPNVGKSTLFNRLTGMHQHTGNWPGKTVGSAYGYFCYNGQDYILADIPGTYSLAARSAEEEVARDALLFGQADIILLVCDATCLQRNMNLALQILEVSGNVIVAVNLIDEAERKGISVDTQLLSQRLGVPIIPISAGAGMGIDVLLDSISGFHPRSPISLCYGCEILQALDPLTDYFDAYRPPLPAQWLAMRMAEHDESLVRSLSLNFGLDPRDNELNGVYSEVKHNLVLIGISPEKLCDICVQTINATASAYCEGVICVKRSVPDRDRKIDRILTHKFWGWPVMIAIFSLILWITISGANYPSQLLSGWLFGLGEIIRSFMLSLHIPETIVRMLIDGVYKTAAWVVSVMLPPMAIFFPLFTLMEDLGYLPRIAFNLDGFFKKCDACGKQALTMCMVYIILQRHFNLTY